MWKRGGGCPMKQLKEEIENSEEGKHEGRKMMKYVEPLP